MFTYNETAYDSTFAQSIKKSGVFASIDNLGKMFIKTPAQKVLSNSMFQINIQFIECNVLSNGRI